MSDETNTIQVESSSDSLGEAPVRSQPATTEKPTAVEPVASESKVVEEDHGDDAGDEDESGVQRPTEPGKENTPDWLQKKLDKLTAKRRTAESERDYWREQALKSTPAKPADRAAEQEGDGLPTLEQFDYDNEKFQAALTRYHVKQALNESRQEAEKQKEQQTIAEKHRAWKEKADEFAETHPDFHAVALNPSLPVSEVMAEVIRESDVGHELLYFLGKNPEEAARIAQMKPHAVGVALARIEASLGTQEEPVQFTDESQDQPNERKVTKAPPPIKTLNPSAPVKRNLAEMSMDDYVAERTRTRRKPNGFL